MQGQTWIYFLTPWGMQLEMVSFPHGKEYEKTATTKLWHPAKRLFNLTGSFRAVILDRLDEKLRGCTVTVR